MSDPSHGHRTETRRAEHAPVDRIQVERSKQIQQQTGRTFHLATRLLPTRIRQQTYVLYAFFRVADEVVDDPDGTTIDEQRAELERIREAALGDRETDDPVLSAFAEVRADAGIPASDVNCFIDAMVSDIHQSRYETYEDLEAYMDGSAAAVGRMMTAIMDPAQRETALVHATALGEAFQLTNFLRDVREDIRERDRIYIPQTTLDRFDVPESTIESGTMTAAFEAAMRYELGRAEQLYMKGVAGIRHLPEDCRFAVLAAAVMYVDYHRLIRSRGYDTLTETPSLSLPRTLYLLARTRLFWARYQDPVVVFRRCAAGLSGSRTIDWCPLDCTRPQF